jgi:putative selenate reductase molybdopterin-binding subunit
MYILSDTGAYSTHGRTVTGNPGRKSMALYVGDEEYRGNPNIRFYADVVYTNTPPAGAYRGYGVPQGTWAVDRHLNKVARELGMDPIEFRLKNALRAGEAHPFSTKWSQGDVKEVEIINTCGLEDCARIGMEFVNWNTKYANTAWHNVPGKPHLRRGIGCALLMQGTAIPNLDMGSASIKINDDGSFNLLIGATDLGTGSDTVLAQQAAEILGVPVEDIVVYSSDTDFTPFDKGAYASSTTYISGSAVIKAAEQIAERVKIRAANMLSEGNMETAPEEIQLADRKARAPDGRFVTMEAVAMDALHHRNQEQIMGIGSHVSPVSPPPFGAQFAEVTVDTITGETIVDRLVIAIDSGVIVNPITASGQADGGLAQALGYALCEEMIYDSQGRAREVDLRDYHIFGPTEMPEIETLFVETIEPSHPFGVKAVAEIVMNGVAPAVANAIADATGVEMDQIPVTPDRLWDQLRNSGWNP